LIVLTVIAIGRMCMYTDQIWLELNVIRVTDQLNACFLFVVMSLQNADAPLNYVYTCLR